MRGDEVLENRLLERWWAVLPRHPLQQNDLHEADAELLPLPGDVGWLAVTTDTLAEEIALGFVADAETAGWLAAMQSLSDLAAVGAVPLGIVVAVTLPDGGETLQPALARGLAAACREAGTFVLGGDTNRGPALAITTTAVGLVDPARALRRVGCRPGDAVYATGRLGGGAVGAAAAAARAGALPELGGPGEPVPPFRPCARMAEGRMLAGLASACMDTSDSLVATLDQLARLNRVGFAVTARLDDIVEPGALALCRRLGMTPLVALAQLHGELELVFTVPPDRVPELERGAAARGFAPLRLGNVTAEEALVIDGRTVDGAAVRNLAHAAGGDLKAYVAGLVALVG
ncbi:MAG: AIR synthase related protein [Thermoanaerobaculaceae bacterium]|jgi:thiamine-monophosphate kinase|nr:AIR synthase related protein [Thermoanaerobaculaceae bacterium]